jgi:uncharacterized protein YceH (UPF0502 family)
MAENADVNLVETALEQLSQREDGPFVIRLAREAGRRDARYAHLFSGAIEVGEDAAPTSNPTSSTASSATSHTDRIERLESLVAELRREVEELKGLLK